jgi:serine/threonine-protein kinase HipA
MDDPAMPTLSLSYQNRTGGLVTSKKPVHRRVPPFFANMLPEGHLRTYLAERAAIPSANSSYWRHWARTFL